METRVIFNDDVLFLHVPKTGGMSVTHYLLDTLPKPLVITHPIHVPGLHRRGIAQVDGARHESLAEARDILRAIGRDIPEFPMVLVGMRNPYDQEVSRYAYLRQGHHWESGPEQDLALASDFETYAIGNCQAGGRWNRYELEANRPRPNEIRDYYMLDGAFPDNLRVIRFEHLAEDLLGALATIGIVGAPEFPWDNRSDHGAYATYYTPAAEAAVYDRYRWVFDQGFYSRLRSAPSGAVQNHSSERR
jgi:hypothetical protein